MKVKCDTCDHKQVCAFKEHYQEAVDNVKSIQIPDTIRIDLSCKHYINIQTTRNYLTGCGAPAVPQRR